MLVCSSSWIPYHEDPNFPFSSMFFSRLCSGQQFQVLKPSEGLQSHPFNKRPGTIASTAIEDSPVIHAICHARRYYNLGSRFKWLLMICWCSWHWHYLLFFVCPSLPPAPLPLASPSFPPLDPPSTTTMPPTTPVRLLTADISATAPGNKQRALITSPTLAPLPEGSLGTIVGGAVGGALFLLLLLILGGVYYQRQRRTFRGDYYTKQYHGPSDMQKAPQPHELQQVYSKGSPDTKLKSNQDNGTIYPDKDREEWGDFDRERSPNGRSRALREATGQMNDHNNHNLEHGYHSNHHPVHPQSFSPAHHIQRSSLQPEPRRFAAPQVMSNGSPYLPEDCYDNDYVSHTDGSMISRREWYVWDDQAGRDCVDTYEMLQTAKWGRSELCKEN